MPHTSSLTPCCDLIFDRIQSFSIALIVKIVCCTLKLTSAYFSSQVAHMAFDELNRKMLFGKTLDLELVKGVESYFRLISVVLMRWFLSQNCSNYISFAFKYIDKKMTDNFISDKDAYTSYPDTSNTEVRRNEPVDDRREPIAPRRFEQREISRRHSDDLVTDEGASSTLFVGNLSGNVRYKDLMSLFKRYGDIEASFRNQNFVAVMFKLLR